MVSNPLSLPFFLSGFILISYLRLTASGKFSTQHFRFTSLHSRLTEKGYGPVHRLSIFIYKVLWTLPLPLLFWMPGMEKQRSYLDACIVLLSKRRLITYRPCSFSVLGYITLSIEELDMRDAMPLVAKGRAKLGKKSNFVFVYRFLLVSLEREGFLSRASLPDR